MEKIRAEIVDTGIPLFLKTQLEINAPAKVIFDLIADPKNHQKIDGSAMLKGELKAPDRLHLGA
ncbi:MAG: polyketide cyclase / dehydrase and lipid transport, partial [Candidatus Nanopelagicaceae bacterium]